jgi:hypothetical protein
VDDFGIDNGLPVNLYLSTLPEGTHHKYLGRLLVYSPDGKATEGNRFPVHNQQGVIHEVRIGVTRRLKLGD